ncbi:TIGR02678 family protein [Rhodococcus spongiicola]|uniref:TIGR02678 family protein n=1 Tax=Rhodococcus spongiicola TaxID=2487352 RepID=A0A3S3ZLA1_9NOCA|nr:TIGR02678 family protein [Rhodococcus spongiicola]RVW03315.1 TIGR02678 family protein [Rhodococcus spongiicola]
MRARTVSPLEIDTYQRAARVILSNHLVTQTYPDRLALPLLRRWATELREDLLELFGYRFEVTETTARLFTVPDRLVPDTPARTPSDRTFDRHRYAYLALTLAALGRAGNQITLSELADHVATEAAQVPGVTLSTERAADRDAFVDAVAWLAARGAIVLADGDAGGWASNPDADEALYDIDRSVVIALFRPPRVLQHLTSVRSLLAVEKGPLQEDTIGHRPADPRETVRRMRRALVERPVVYADELTDDERLQLALPRTAGAVEDLTGLVAERRAEGVAMIDPSGRMSDIRFPSTGTISQVALLLAGEVADRVLDPDAPRLQHRPLPDSSQLELATQLDAAIPTAGIFEQLAEDPAAVSAASPPVENAAEPARYPLLDDAWLADAVGGLARQFGRTFAAQWQADHAGLRRNAIALLDRLDLIREVDDGVLALPAIARFRGVVVNIRHRNAQSDLFHEPVTGRTDGNRPVEK